MPLLKWVPSRGTLPPSPPLALPGSQAGRSRAGQSPAGHSQPDAPACVDADVPVLFLHGVLGSPGNFEAPARALVERGRPFFAPAYGDHGTAALEDSFDELSAYLERLRDQGVTQVDAVGHSAGGLMALQLSHAHPAMFRSIIGLGAAFHGVPRRFRVPRAVKLIGGQALLDIARNIEADLPADTPLLSIYSTGDFIVPPARSKLGREIELVGVRHEDLPRQREAIMKALDEVSAMFAQQRGNSAGDT